MQLQGHDGPVYVAVTTKAAVPEAVERYKNTTIGVMDNDGNVKIKSTRKRRK